MPSICFNVISYQLYCAYVRKLVLLLSRPIFIQLLFLWRGQTFSHGLFVLALHCIFVLY